MLEEKLRKKQEELNNKLGELNIIERRRQQLMNEILELQGQIKLLQELLASRKKKEK